jgi:hypothetical protein
VHIEEQIESFGKLQSCGYQGVACLDAWLHENDTSFSYVYVLKKNPADRTTLLCCRPLIATMGQTDTYAKVFENLDVVIYRRLP